MIGLKGKNGISELGVMDASKLASYGVLAAPMIISAKLFEKKDKRH